MPSPTRWQKTVIVGSPVLLATTALTAHFTHGLVWAVAFGVYGLLSAALVWWLWRTCRRNDARAARSEVPHA